MKYNLINKVVTGVLALTLSVGLVGCGKVKNTNGEGSKKKTLNIGVSVGPYNELFNDAIEPILEKQGYTINKINFSDLLLSNVGITEGSVDFNVAQHSAYANNYNKEKNANLTPIVHIPTVPAGIFSNKHTSVKEIGKGQKVAIPKDPSNAARAFRLLAKAGWVKLKDGVEPMKLTINDIVENTYNIEIIQMDSAQIPRSLDDIDFAVLPGSIVYASKINPEKSLLSEDVIKELELVVIVDKKNVDSKWAKDIVAAYKSKEFKEYMAKNNKNNYWFIPDELK